MEEDLRIDKWLWAVRIYKTRSEAADACRAGKVMINDAFCKPSREIKAGDRVSVRKVAIATFTWRVVGLVSNRQPAKEVPRYAENITPQSELDKLNVPNQTVFVQRERGTGRPTKKERREIDTIYDELFYD